MYSEILLSEWDRYPFIVVKSDTVVEVNKQFIDITEFSSSELLNSKIWDIFKILRVGSNIDISNINERADYFLFSKSLKVKFFNIKVINKIQEKIFVFMEKPHSNLDTKFPFVNRLLEDNKYGIAIFSMPDITLLKANEAYISYFDSPYNKKENCIGRCISEFVTGFPSASEKLWNTVLNTGETCHIDEYKFGGFERGVTYWKVTLTPIYEDGEPKYCIEMTTDITEQVLYRKNVELQAKIIEDQNRQLRWQADLLNLSTEAIFTWYLDGGIAYWNKGAEEMYGYGYKEAIDSSIHSLLNTSFSSNFREVIASLLNNGIWSGELESTKKDGKKIIIETKMQLITDEAGRHIVLEIDRDITERKRSEDDLKQQKEQLEAIIASMSDGLLIGEKNLNLTFLNKPAKDFFHNSENINNIKDLIKYNNFFYDSDGAEVPLVELPGYRVFNKGKFNDYRLTIVRQGKKIYVSVNGSPIYDADGKVKAAVLCIRDISDKVKYELELKEQEEQLKVIIENMSDALFLINTDGSYNYLNKRATELAYRPEMIQKTGDSSIHTKYYEMNGRQLSKDDLPSLKVLQGEKLDNVILKAVRPDKTLYLSFNCSPVYDHKGNLSVAVVCIRDMSDYIKKEIELEESQLRLLKTESEKNEALEKAMEMKDEFLSMISHELRTPLNVISSAIQVMNHVCKDDFSDKAKEYLGMIRQNTNRQLRLVNNLLDITRADAGRININKKNLDIVFLTRVITESVYEFALRKGVSINFESSVEEKIIGIDEDKYERILLYLLSNAIKFTPSGKSIKVNVRKKNDCICIKVEDSGIGIPQDRINVIFERFGQVNSSLSRQAEGAGIGLSLVKKFVEALGGTISVSSIENKGTTFTIILPAKIASEEPEKNMMMESWDERLIQVATVEFSDIYL